jgi:hypothetical protein
VTNGALKAISGDELLVNDDHMLFAKWMLDDSVVPGGESIFAWEPIDANTVRITGFRKSGLKVSTLVIPDTIGGLPVTEIGDSAFANSESGMERLILPRFCVNIGYAAFSGISSLKEIKFADVRKWSQPDTGAELLIGDYAFAGAGILSVVLPETVGEIGDYAFANCQSLSNITILGRPDVGEKPFRRAGIATNGVTVHLDPALASDSEYMAALKQECNNVTVRADAVVTRMTLSSFAMSQKEVTFLVSVEKATEWGLVDVSSIKVSYRANLSDEPVFIVPNSVIANMDGSFTVKAYVPEEASGFFQIVLGK